MLKRGECEKGKHKLEILQLVAEYPDLMQLLKCKFCGRKFWGFGGERGEPKWLHAIAQMPNLREPLTFYEKS